MKTAAVVGARSMLGRSLVQQLKAQGIETLSVGRAAEDDIVFDLRADEAMLPEGLSADVLFHCAAGFADNSPQGLRENFTLNTASALGIGTLTQRLGAAVLVYAGSVSSDRSLDGDNFTAYGLTKALAEQVLGWTMQQQRGRFCSLRFSQLYDAQGLCCRHQPWFGRIIAYTSRGLDMRLPASLGPRNFIHVEDAAALMIRSAMTQVSGELDIVHPESLTWQEIAALARDVFGCGGQVVDAPEKAPFRAVRFPSGAQAFERLGAAPGIGMAQGIAMIRQAGTSSAFGPMDIT